MTGLVKCEHCGYAFTIRFSKTKEGQTPYFCCSGKYLHKACDAKQTHRVRDVEEEVQARLIEHASTYHLAHKQTEDAVAKEFQYKISEIDAKIENLIVSLENVSNVSAQYINQRIETLHQEKQLLMYRYNKAIAEYNIAEVEPFSAADWEEMPLEEKRNMARSMIKAVFLSEDGIDVKFKLKKGGHKP